MDELPEVRVNVAEYAVAREGSLITVGLGSCVAIALYDGTARVGGLAHVLLPAESMARDRSNPAKFAETAVPLLVDRMCAVGARANRLEAKIAGGASMFANLIPSGGINIGERNVRAVRDALSAAGVPLTGEDTGSDYGRSVYLFLEDGRVEVRSLRGGARVL